MTKVICTFFLPLLLCGTFDSLREIKKYGYQQREL